MSAFDIIIIILTIIGSLGVFLFGMIMMSESLQKVAGRRMRKVLSTLTSNNLRGILSGLSITGAIQSSSATTVMVVSFVNAGLLSVRRSFSLIMGANIGTTVTAWIIVLLGFSKTFNITTIILPIVALSLPLLFSGRNKHRSWAEFIFGFAILFLGLQFLKTSIPLVDESSVFVQHFRDLIYNGFWSVLLFVGIGILLTLIFQSSSAVMAFTFVIAVDGWVPFDMAAAMVLGENIGTTVTANIAALVANRSAKRSAFFHFFFNFVGVIWALLFFSWLLDVVSWSVLNATGNSPENNTEIIPLALAIFHSGFNVLNSLFFIGIIPITESIIKRIIPDGDNGSEKFLLRHIGSSYLSTSELSLVQAKQEIQKLSNLTIKMFNLVPVFLIEKDAKPYKKLYKKIKKYEKITDRIEVEVYTYLTKLSESKLSEGGSEEVRKMIKVTDELESIADAAYKMASSIYKKNKASIYFKQDIRDHLNTMFELIESSLHIMHNNLKQEIGKADTQHALEIEKEINKLRDIIRKNHPENLKKEKYNFQTGLIFNDIIMQCEKIGDHCYTISQTIASSD
jgi:phosphate:Na+ symporter